MSNYDFERRKMQEILTHLQAMTLPAAGSTESVALGNEWHQRHDQIKELVGQAERYALLTVPDEIADLLMQIQDRKWSLLLPKKQEDSEHA